MLVIYEQRFDIHAIVNYEAAKVAARHAWKIGKREDRRAEAEIAEVWALWTTVGAFNADYMNQFHEAWLIRLRAFVKRHPWLFFWV